MDAMVRTMTIEDYEGIYELWMKIKGFAMRSIDDSKEGVERFWNFGSCNAASFLYDIF